MGNYFKKNVEFFQQTKRKNINIEKIENSKSYELIYMDENADFIKKDGQIYEIKYELDSENLPIFTKREIYFILGIANVNELFMLFQKANPRSIFYIIEPNLSFLKMTFESTNFEYFQEFDIRLFADTLENLPLFLEEIFSTEDALLIKNLRLYPTYYYRNFDFEVFRGMVGIISSSVKHNLFKYGNSIEDSLIGLKHNIYNLRYFPESIDFVKMKDVFKGKPAIIVAAGPSLEKNIGDLKQSQGKAIILAVDTIIEKLLNHGIVPDFVFAIERVDEVYEYFFKKKIIPKEVTLVVPSVVKSEIIEEYKGKFILPLRDKVHEYRWLNRMLQLDDSVYLSMGMSVAHLAFGFAHHLGAYPIIFVGQDLAYEGDKSHSGGTVYDTKKIDDIEKIEVEGYYGTTVYTSDIWIDFKRWFELEIQEKNIDAIDATEGGSRIAYTKQMSLKEVNEKYCIDYIHTDQIISKLPLYSVTLDEISNRLDVELKQILEIEKYAKKILRNLEGISISYGDSEKLLMKKIEKMKETDILLNTITQHPLLMHNLQPFILHIFQEFYKIDETLTAENVKQNLRIQIKLTSTIIQVIEKIINIINDNSDYKAKKKV